MGWRFRIASLAGALSALIAGATAHAQKPPGDPSNAATWYWAAYAEYRAVKFEMDLYEHAAAFEADPDRGPSPVARKHFQRYREAINLTKRAVRRELCDFGPYDPLDRNKSFDPSISRALAKALRDDYLVRVFDGDVNEAIDDLCGEYRIARHVASQRGVLPVLVGAALVSLTDGLVQHAIDRGIVGPGEATRLLDEKSRFKGDDPLGMREALIIEQTAVIDGYVARYSADDGVQRFRDAYLPYYRQERDEPAIAALESMTREDLDRQLEMMRALPPRIIAALSDDDIAKSRDLLETIDNEVETGQHGRFAPMFFGYTASSLKQMEHVRKTLDDRRTMLEGIASGEVDPMSLANAACWYIRAGVRLAQADPAALEVIDEWAARADADAAADNGLVEALARAEVRESLEMLATASSIKRCDFSYAKPYWTECYRAYHAELLACARLLLADAARQARAGASDAAAVRLAQAFRLSAALAGDGCIAGALSAHRIFNDADAITAKLIERGAFAPAQLQTLRTEIDRFSRADPFHYQPAVAALRKDVLMFFAWFVRGAPSVADMPRTTPQKDFDDAEAILNLCDADRMLTLDAMCEELYMTMNPTAKPVRAPIDGLSAIFDVEAMQRARELTPVLMQWAKMNVIAGVPQADLPVIAPIEARMKQAEADYRACLQRLGADAALP